MSDCFDRERLAMTRALFVWTARTKGGIVIARNEPIVWMSDEAI
jgi:hypothetical protein